MAPVCRRIIFRMRRCRAMIACSDSTPPRNACMPGVFARRSKAGPRSSHGSSQKFAMAPCSTRCLTFSIDMSGPSVERSGLLQIGLEHIDDAPLLVDHRDVPPLVEGRARMRDAEPEQVADGQLAIRYV